MAGAPNQRQNSPRGLRYQCFDHIALFYILSHGSDVLFLLNRTTDILLSYANIWPVITALFANARRPHAKNIITVGKLNG